MTRGRLAFAALLALLLGTGRVGAEPSRVVFPVSERPLRFSHATHAKQGCASCHEQVARSPRAADKLTPPETVCRRCHVIDRTGKPGTHAKSCELCHPAWTAQGFPRLTEKRTPQLKFSHRLHATQPCVRCHVGVEESRRPSLSHLPEMSTCLECHSGKRRLRCSGCHLADASGRLRTRLDSGVLIPRGTLRADRHGAAFLSDHRVVGRDRAYCESCHRQDQCLRCHNGGYRVRSIHGTGYTLLHGADARRNRPNCSSCHRGQTFCVSCHERSGVSEAAPKNPFRPGVGGVGSGVLRFHPQGWVDHRTRGAATNLHAAQARRNPRSCSSCHREDTCVRCHGTKSGNPAKISPHGPGFASSAKCRSMAKRNVRVCHKCHDPLNTPRCR
jgi:hypothetical protein